MIFSSITFLSLFLPLVLATYFLAPGIKAKNTVLLIASLVFYAWGEAEWTWIVLLSILLNWLFGGLVARSGSKHAARAILALCIAVNLGILSYFKYLGFAVAQINPLLHWAGFASLSATSPHLPLGISFYTFHGLTYNIDIYYRRARPQTLFNVALYKMFFPQLIAGPIVRYNIVAEALSNRGVSVEGFALGVQRFIVGLAKKVLIANTLAVPADMIFATPAEDLTTPLAWLGIICYTLQIYYDFSGYSDMAIGLAKMFGFPFPENFNFPYAARSIRDFWRRWHMTLSGFFRDYVYIPLGGNRHGPLRTYLNLILIFFLTGLWHGASWNFVIWGLMHGAFLILERSGFERILERLPAAVGTAYTLTVVIIAWVFFRAPDIPHALSFLTVMGGSANNEPTMATQSVFFYLDPLVATAIVAGILCAGPQLRDGILSLSLSLTINMPRLRQALAAIAPPVRMVVLWVMLSVSWLSVASGAYNPFIYFRF
jgi:alginate O-acetyltransferase complex protein AlgI